MFCLFQRLIGLISLGETGRNRSSPGGKVSEEIPGVLKCIGSVPDEVPRVLKCIAEIVPVP